MNISQRSFTSGNKHQNWHKYSSGIILLKEETVSQVKIQDGRHLSHKKHMHGLSHEGTPWTELDDFGIDSYVSTDHGREHLIGLNSFSGFLEPFITKNRNNIHVLVPRKDRRKQYSLAFAFVLKISGNCYTSHLQLHNPV